MVGVGERLVLQAADLLAVVGPGAVDVVQADVAPGRAADPARPSRGTAPHGRTLAEADLAFPSSQTCPACGFRDGPKPLYVREWTCGECGTVRDRDHNADRRDRIGDGAAATLSPRPVNLGGASAAPVLSPGDHSQRGPLILRSDHPRARRWIRRTAVSGKVDGNRPPLFQGPASLCEADA
ncbi:zinc ribbon domain-containing protein [Streptomyces spongiicola]